MFGPAEAASSSLSRSDGEVATANAGAGGASDLSPTEAEAGMAEMSQRLHDEGGEIYLPTDEGSVIVSDERHQCQQSDTPA
jgi:hypothetical protein